MYGKNGCNDREVFLYWEGHVLDGSVEVLTVYSMHILGKELLPRKATTVQGTQISNRAGTFKLENRRELRLWPWRLRSSASCLALQ